MTVVSRQTSTLSIVLALIDCEHVVSVFPLDADGEVNTAEEYYFRAFEASTVAIQVYIALERAILRVERDGTDPCEGMRQAAAMVRREFYPDVNDNYA